jgi:hypothetical protein
MRAPDREINGVYLHRWYIIPKNRWFNIYLHKFQRSDDDRALHDHPWVSCSFLLKGEILEHHQNGTRHVSRWFPVFRTAKFAHRIELVKGPVWTIFITGPKTRTWGFYTQRGWLRSDVFLKEYGERT